jgi:uncharacterized protein (TIGR02186 family)
MRCRPLRLPVAPLALLVVAVASFLAAPMGARALEDNLIVDLSEHVIEIDSSFTGTSILLFGVTDTPDDVIVTARGPVEPTVVRRKRRVAGIWVNRDAVAFDAVPRYYALAASRPLDDLELEDLLVAHKIGVEQLALEPLWVATEEPIATFREALRRIKARSELYPTQLGEVRFIDDSLFRATLNFPANVPLGHYEAEIFLIQDGRMTELKTTPLEIRKSGLSAELFGFANQSPALYGLIAIAAALVAGWVGSLVFRKV